jgi:hypothetical protein
MLNAEQKQRHRDEVAVNLGRSGFDLVVLACVLGFAAERLERTLALDRHSDPTDAWLVRDFLDQVVRDRGLESASWTVLVNHDMARQWFPILAPPATPPAGPRARADDAPSVVNGNCPSPRGTVP